MTALFGVVLRMAAMHQDLYDYDNDSDSDNESQSNAMGIMSSDGYKFFF